MSYQNFIEQLVPLIGGKDNIEAVVHCMTRLRFTLKDRALAQTEKIQEMDKVVDVVSNNISYQVIIGTEVADIYPELLSYLGMESAEEKNVDKNIVKRILDLMSETVTPILPAMMSAGLIAAILSIFVSIGVLSPEGSTYIILDTLRSAMFSFLSIFVAVSAAKRLGAPLYLAILLAVSLVSPSIDGVEGLSLFGIGLPTITYTNTFIPILMGVALMGKVTTILKKVIPKSLDYFFTPVITLLIVFPVTLFIFGPIGMGIAQGLSFLIQFLFDHVGSWAIFALYAAIHPFVILMGAGNLLIPITLNFFTELGYDPVLLPAMMIADLSVAGTMFGYMLRAKDKKQKEFFGSVSFTAFMGITEPAIYGAFIKYRRPFIAVAVSAGIGGLIAGLSQVKAYAMVGLFGIMTYMNGGNYRNLIMVVIAIVVAVVLSVISGYLLWIPKDQQDIKDNASIENTDVKKKSMKKVVLEMPVDGEKIPLSDVKDKAFSTGALGKGIGIIPSENTIKAPFSGEVVSLFPTGHALGVQGEEGVEVLIHVGIDTVQLDGKYFTPLVKQGDKVAAGEPLLSVDVKKIEEAGYDPTVIMVVTNSADFLEIVSNVEAENEQTTCGMTVVV